MNVNNINNKDLVNNNNIRADKAEQAGRPEATESKNSVSESTSSPRDSVSITHSQYGNEVQFARQVFQNLNNASLDKLQQVKAKIKNNDYNNPTVHKSVSSKIEGALNALQSNSTHQTQVKTDADGDHDGDTSAIADNDHQ